MEDKLRLQDLIEEITEFIRLLGVLMLMGGIMFRINIVLRIKLKDLLSGVMMGLGRLSKEVLRKEVLIRLKDIMLLEELVLMKLNSLLDIIPLNGIIGEIVGGENNQLTYRIYF